MAENARSTPGARRLGPGYFDTAWPNEKRKDIVDRLRYLVRADKLEEPPYILKARLTLEESCQDWEHASEKDICDILAMHRGPLFQGRSWGKENPEYNILTGRIYKAQIDYYDLDKGSGSGKFLDTLCDPSSSFLFQRLNKAGLTVNKMLRFERGGIAEKNRRVAARIKEKRGYFFLDIAGLLEKAQRRGKIEYTTYELPPEIDADDECISAILGINEHTFLVDSTLNSGFLQAIQEADLKPAVIMKDLTFWKDGADHDVEALKKVDWLDYNTTHWLTEHYDVDVDSKRLGSGFVTCSPTVYVRKGTSLAHVFKAGLTRASTFLSRRSTTV